MSAFEVALLLIGSFDDVVLGEYLKLAKKFISFASLGLIHSSIPRLQEPWNTDILFVCIWCVCVFRSCKLKSINLCIVVVTRLA